MVCYYFTSDLMFTSKVKPFAQENGWTLQFPAFEAIDFSSIPDLILIDLDDVTSPDLDDLMRKFREKWKDLPATVAYGPHVKEARLQHARDVGVGTVLTRGQFHKQFTQWFPAKTTP